MSLRVNVGIQIIVYIFKIAQGYMAEALFTRADYASLLYYCGKNWFGVIR